MAHVQDLASDLTIAGISFKEVNEMVDNVYRDKGMKRRQNSELIKQLKDRKNPGDHRHFKPKKNVLPGQFSTSVVATIKVDRRIYIMQVRVVPMASFGTMSLILHKEVDLVKKSARWMSKELSQEQNEERVRCSKAFIKLIQNPEKAILGKIIIMDKMVVLFNTHENKNMSTQWLKEGTTGPCKDQVHSGRSKQMVLAVFDNKGMV
jgi:hypothetical protein